MFNLNSLVFAALTLVSFSSAQNSTIIKVGAGGLTFTPPSVNVTKGNVVTFQFAGSPGNHSVTQAAFANPCDPLSGGFDSGFVFTPANITTGFAEWNLTITNDTAPIWFFCKQASVGGVHCKSGMVGAINAPATGNTYDKFLAAAKAFNGTSGQTEGGLGGVGASATSPPGPFTGSITGYGNPTATAPSASSSGSSTAKPTSTGAASTVSANSFLLFLGSVVALLA
jgi:hypothetical protein